MTKSEFLVKQLANHMPIRLLEYRFKANGEIFYVKLYLNDEVRYCYEKSELEIERIDGMVYTKKELCQDLSDYEFIKQIDLEEIYGI